MFHRLTRKAILPELTGFAFEPVTSIDRGPRPFYPGEHAIESIDPRGSDAIEREPRRFGTVVCAFGDLYYVFTGGDHPWVDEGGVHVHWNELRTTPGMIHVMSMP